MVKIKTKIIILGLMFVFLMHCAFAATNSSMMEISDFDVKVGGKKDSGLSDGDTISREAAPEDSIELDIEIKNLYDSSNGDLDIEDITITATLEGIDDGDDLEEEGEISKLRPGKDKRVSLNFKVPLKVEEDSYDITIDVDGEDENGTDQTLSWTLTLDVEKEKHNVMIYKKALSNDILKCDRTTQLTAGVINIGQEEEEDATLEVTNADLGISQKETFDLSEDIDDDDNTFTKTYYFDIDKDKKAGTYPITIKTTYDDGDEVNQEVVNLVLQDCESAVKEEVKEEEKVTVTTTPAATITPATTTISEPQITAIVEEDTFYAKNKYAIWVGLAYLIVIASIVMIAVKLFVKR